MDEHAPEGPEPGSPQPQPPYQQQPDRPPYPQPPGYQPPYQEPPPYQQQKPDQPPPFQQSYPQPLYQPAGPGPGYSTGPMPGGGPVPAAAPPPVTAPAEPWVERGDVRAAGLLAGVLVVAGILAGVLWSAISPHAQGVVVTKTQIIPFEQENWIAADGRFALITALIGLVAGVAAWFWRARRGPVLVAGLAIGAGVGALLTALVGYWLSSGHDSGAVNTEIQLKVLVHAHGLIPVEAVLALAAYLVGALFSGPDDLGRTSVDPIREPVTAGTVGPQDSGRPVAGSSPFGFGADRPHEGP